MKRTQLTVTLVAAAVMAGLFASPAALGGGPAAQLVGEVVS